MKAVLTASQQVALEALLHTRENLFITGAPGTGKSFLVNEFLKVVSFDVPVMASTGAAALLVGGRTFHSFFGLGILQGTPEQVLEKALRNSRLRKRLRETDTILVDEVSMLSSLAFDMAERIARRVRESEAPWGGMRVLIVGDFAQLPPISRTADRPWAFLGEAWGRSGFRTLVLREIKRTDEKGFLEVLADLRQGVLTERLRDFLDARVLDEPPDDVPRVFPRRAQTDAFNRARLEAIQATLCSFRTLYSGDGRYVERLKNDAPVPEVLELKEGALVMFRMNDPRERFVNGTVGRITALRDGILEIQSGRRRIELEPFTFTVLDDEGEEAASATNFPVALAWACTIHKIQGATLDALHADLRRLWEPGQGYVALSRVRRAEGLTLSGWDSTAAFADPRVRAFEEASETEIEIS